MSNLIDFGFIICSLELRLSPQSPVLRRQNDTQILAVGETSNRAYKKWFQNGTDMLLITTSTANDLLRNVNIGDLD